MIAGIVTAIGVAVAVLTAEPASDGRTVAPAAVGVVLGVVVALVSGVAVAALVTYAVARVFLVRDAAAVTAPAWQHDGILVGHTGPDAEPLSPELAGPLAAAADAAEARMVWGVVVGWAQCVFGAAAFVVVVVGMVVGAGVPWILALVTFIIGGLGQDMAARSTRTLGRVAEARRRVAEARHRIDEQPPAAPHGPDVLPRAMPAAPAVVRGPGPLDVSRRTARRMPPRSPGRGSSLELPGE